MMFRMPQRKSAAETTDARGAVPVALTERANRVVNEWLDRHGGSKTKFVERLLEFFAAAPDSVQLMMAGRTPEDLREHFADAASEYFLSLKEQKFISETGRAANQAVEMEREQPRRAPKKSA